jgi:hypothetical protein
MIWKSTSPSEIYTDDSIMDSEELGEDVGLLTEFLQYQQEKGRVEAFFFIYI